MPRVLVPREGAYRRPLATSTHRTAGLKPLQRSSAVLENTNVDTYGPWGSTGPRAASHVSDHQAGIFLLLAANSRPSAQSRRPERESAMDASPTLFSCLRWCAKAATSAAESIVWPSGDNCDGPYDPRLAASVKMLWKVSPSGRQVPRRTVVVARPGSNIPPSGEVRPRRPAFSMTFEVRIICRSPCPIL